VPDGAFVSDIQYVTFRPCVDEQSANAMNHHLGRIEMNFRLLSQRTMSSSASAHPDDSRIDVFNGTI